MRKLCAIESEIQIEIASELHENVECNAKVVRKGNEIFENC